MLRFRQFVMILPLLWGASQAQAQVPQEASSMPEQWQLTLDVIKSKAQTLMVQNNGLQLEYRQLMGQAQKLQQSIDEQQRNNERMGRLLKDRHGRTDEQARIEELTAAIKTKAQEARVFDGQFADLRKKQADLDNKIGQLKHTIADLQPRQQAEKAQVPQQMAEAQGDDLAPWRKQLEDENRQEVLLENELGNLKTGDKMKGLNVDAIDQENRQLEAHLDMLKLQKLHRIKRSSDTVMAQSNARRYDQLKKRKDELEISINAYESRLDELRQSSLMALSWPVKKKKLIHEMVQTDAHNNQLRDKIKVLHEDIDVLKDQVARLERRVDFAQGKNSKS